MDFGAAGKKQIPHTMFDNVYSVLRDGNERLDRFVQNRTNRHSLFGKSWREDVIDRRVQRTRDALHHALIALILEKGYDAVTVQDIIDRANVGRSTFYAHFVGKEDLLKAGLTELGKMLREHQRRAHAAAGSARDRCLGFVLPLFEHAQDHADLYRAIVGKRSGAVVINRLREVLVELVRDDLKVLAATESPTGIPRGAVVQFTVGALLSVLTWWVDQKPRISAGEAVFIFQRLIQPALASVEIF